jgi:hypothetical protein
VANCGSLVAILMAARLMASCTAVLFSGVTVRPLARPCCSRPFAMLAAIVSNTRVVASFGGAIAIAFCQNSFLPYQPNMTAHKLVLTLSDMNASIF